MFDNNIQYYAYNNEAGDDFGVGYLGNKEFWIHLINGWQRNDGLSHRYVVEEWEELSSIADLRGCLLAEVVPDDQEYIVTWAVEDKENTVRITHDNKLVWEENNTKGESIPRWVSRLKNQIRDSELN